MFLVQCKALYELKTKYYHSQVFLALIFLCVLAKTKGKEGLKVLKPYFGETFFCNFCEQVSFENSELELLLLKYQAKTHIAVIASTQ